MKINRHTNIILSAPHRYDLPEWSCVNCEVQSFNRKLMKLMKPFEHVNVVNLVMERECYTKHGQHMNKRGKRKVASQLAMLITTILQEQRTVPICLHWKNNLEDEKTQALGEYSISINSLKKIVSDKEIVTCNVIRQDVSTEEAKESSEKGIQLGSTENLEYPSVKVVRSSKRLKKTTTVTKKNDFLGEKERV